MVVTSEAEGINYHTRPRDSTPQDTIYLGHYPIAQHYNRLTLAGTGGPHAHDVPCMRSRCMLCDGRSHRLQASPPQRTAAPHRQCPQLQTPLVSSRRRYTWARTSPQASHTRCATQPCPTALPHSPTLAHSNMQTPSLQRAVCAHFSHSGRHSEASELYVATDSLPQWRASSHPHRVQRHTGAPQARARAAARSRPPRSHPPHRRCQRCMP